MSFSNTNKLVTDNFYSVALSGSNGIAGSNSNLGLWYSTNTGQTWTQSNVTTGNFISVALSGSNGIAGSASNLGIYYTTNSGQTWTRGDLTTGGFTTDNFQSVALFGTNGIAGSASNFGIYYTDNSGQTWRPSNITNGNFNSVSISGLNGIAGSASNFGIYNNISAFCYEKNTLILVLENNIELYKKICELKVGDTVKTYKHGYKNIKCINSFKYNPSYTKRNKRLLYKMKNHDVIVTGKHGILVDEVTEEEIIRTKKCGTTIRQIDDKQVLPACASDKFEKITDDKDFELWHFVLENDDETKNYGIYITGGILSESCSEKAFLYA